VSGNFGTLFREVATVPRVGKQRAEMRFVRPPLTNLCAISASCASRANRARQGRWQRARCGQHGLSLGSGGYLDDAGLGLLNASGLGGIRVNLFFRGPTPFGAYEDIQGGPANPDSTPRSLGNFTPTAVTATLLPAALPVGLPL
jgi:hypothetical protein